MQTLRSTVCALSEKRRDPRTRIVESVRPPCRFAGQMRSVCLTAHSASTAPSCIAGGAAHGANANSVRAGGTGRTASGRSNRTRRQSGSPTPSSSGFGESVAARLLPLYIGRTVGAPSFQVDGANAAAPRPPRASRGTASRPVRSGNLFPPAPGGAGFKPKETTTRSALMPSPSAARPSSTTGRFLQDHAPTHNEHPCPGYRTLRSACVR